ncbi:MAG: prepilin-type N-terminal cleavage/methylation domain-containing protein [Planctomycetota bacterium]|nr:prepilin-type N-terminal cleavage/methylation domain-containing protein [Planctomycetota bacterium]
MGRDRRRGLTLVELAVAVTITSVTALAVAGLSIALGNSYSGSQEFSDSIRTGRSATLTIQSALRRANLVTAANGQALMFWTDDTNSDGLINLDEMRVILWDNASGTVKSHQVVFPDAMGPATKAALNVRILLSDATNMKVMKAYIDASRYEQVDVLAEEVAQLQVQTTAAPPMTTLVKTEFTVDGGRRNLTIRSAASLRADKTDYVEFTGGVYVLNPIKGPDDGEPTTTIRNVGLERPGTKRK